MEHKTSAGAVRGLGEIALRVDDLDAMHKFYEEVVGLEVMRRYPDGVFFGLAKSHGGHTQLLALFDRSAEPEYQGLDAKKSTVDHLAFEISLSDYDEEKKRLEEKGLEVTAKQFGWTHNRSLFFTDPEGNRLELVCYDESIQE